MLSRQRANALVLSLTVLCVGLIVVAGLLWQRSRMAPGVLADHALADGKVREAVIAELVERGAGIFDSHPDPDVAYVLQPDLVNRRVGPSGISTNHWGLRERPFGLPKPDGTLRVVLLGDSYIHGNGVHIGERLGVALERMLAERSAGSRRTVECLHVGVPSWNIVAECAFVRRLLHVLEPDLVIQVVVPNDLDDMAGVRGFGSLASFAPRDRRRGSLLVRRTDPAIHGFAGTNYLLHALDHESRSRYEEARAAIAGLRRALAETGCGYLLVLNWMSMLPVGYEELGRTVDPDQLAMLPKSFFLDDAYRVSPTNGHWNAAGHVRVAQALYHLIRSRGLLPALSLSPWPEAERVWTGFAEDAARELEAGRRDENLLRPSLRPAIDFTALDGESALQIHGGIVATHAGPHASWLLANRGAETLVLRGRFLPATALAGATVRAHLEELVVGEITCAPGEDFSLRVPVPDALRERPYLNVRVTCDDFVHGGEDFRMLISVRIFGASLE